jgi:hypothetical protein
VIDRVEHDFRGVGELCFRCRLPSGKHRKRKFVGIACRGGDVDGKHVLLEVVAVREDGKTIARAFDETGLSLDACLKVLFSTSKRDVCFGFGTSYDATKIFSGVGDGAGEIEKFFVFHAEARTMKRDGKTITPLFRWRGHGYGFDSSGYTVARGRTEKRWKQTVRVWNIEAMTRRSFEASLKNWGVPWKKNGDLGDRAHAIALLAKAVTSEVSSWRVDLQGRYRGPGSIAGTIMRFSGVDACNGTVHELEELVMKAYFGGRSGVRQIGPVSGCLKEYDLTSAYAAAMRDLPCLACGEWTQAQLAHNPTIRLLRFRVRSQKDLTWAPLPCRVNGDVVYGTNFEGWAWHPEIQAAVWPPTPWSKIIEVVGGWAYETNCKHRPFHFIGEWFERRRELEKSGKTGPSELVKQVLAAVYGKVAQRFPSDLQSYVWAGLTTSLVRAKLLKAIASEDVYAVETDSVVLKGKLPTGEGLGDWALKNTFPKGIFFTASSQHFGLESRDVEAREIRRAFRAGEESAIFRQRAFHDGRSATIAMVRCRRCGKSWSLSGGLLCGSCGIVGGVPRGGFLETRPYGTWGWEGREVGLRIPTLPDLGGRESEAYKPEKR